MRRQPELDQIQRLSFKTLNQVFIARAQEWHGCLFFHTQALIELIREVHFPWLAQPKTIQAVQLTMAVVSAEKPGHEPVSKFNLLPVCR